MLLLLLLKIKLKASYRQLLSTAQELYPDEKLPSLNDLFYRFRKLPEERLHQFLNGLHKKTVLKAYSDEVKLLPYGTKIVGDKLYCMRVRVLEEVEMRGY